MNSGGLCRSFKRAAAAGEELQEDVVNQLLRSLSAGELFTSVTPVCRQFLA